MTDGRGADGRERTMARRPPMLRTAHIAVDLGAETGRVIVGAFEGGLCKLHECHRFEHAALPMPAGLSWDLTGLWRETLRGLTAAAELCRNRGLRPLSVGVDTWGVDFALLSRSGELLGLPRSYRDPAFAEVADAVRARVSPRTASPTTTWSCAAPHRCAMWARHTRWRRISPRVS